MNTFELRSIRAPFPLHCIVPLPYQYSSSTSISALRDLTMNNITLGPNTLLKPIDNNALKSDRKFKRTLSASPAKELSPGAEQPPSHASPIRRSGSPVRRQQIQEIENKYRSMKRKAEELESPEKKVKSVQFNENVHYFQELVPNSNTITSASGPGTVTSAEQGPTVGSILQDIQMSQKKLRDDIQEIKEGQKYILQCLETIMKKMS